MILALLILPILYVTANPFSKYPYVFLLDVGNEELEKVNTEQIRISSPGGSVALRHPAIGNGDDIAHVRVSGIDFGTDLKANIVDGGPGYKYVVIVLIGKPGVAYDAVITIQTLLNGVSDANIQTIEDEYPNGNVNNDIPKIYKVSEGDMNNSAEELNDDGESEPRHIHLSDNEGLTQESVNLYSYVQNEAVSDRESDQIVEEAQSSRDGGGNEQIKDIDYDQDQNEEDPRINQPLAERYTADDYSQDNNQPIVVDQNLYNKYESLKDHLYDGSDVVPQGYIQQSDLDDQNYDRPIEEMYDDYGENESGQYKEYDNFKDINEAPGNSAVEQ